MSSSAPATQPVMHINHELRGCDWKLNIGEGSRILPQGTHKPRIPKNLTSTSRRTTTLGILVQWRIYIVKFWTPPLGPILFPFYAVFGKIW